MTPNLNEAAENVKSLSRLFTAVQDVAAALDNIGSIDQATSEAHARMVEARELTREAEEKRAEAEQALNTAAAQHAEALAAVANAQAHAQSVLAAAGERANTIVENARNEAQGYADEATADMRDAEAALARVNKAIDERNAELAKVNALLDAAQEARRKALLGE